MYFADIPPENRRSQITHKSQFTVSCLKTKCPTKETVSKKPHKLYIKSFLSRKTFILICGRPKRGIGLKQAQLSTTMPKQDQLNRSPPGAEEMLPLGLVRALLLFIFYISVVTGLDHPSEPKESFILVLVRGSEFLALLFLKLMKETSVSHCSGQR